MKPLQVAADRDRLGETRPVVELQHRHSAGWVPCEEFRSAALTSENIDILQRKLDSFFRREDANPARIWSYCMIVKLHCISHFEPSKTPLDDFISHGEPICLRRAPYPFLGSLFLLRFLILYVIGSLAHLFGASAQQFRPPQ